MYILVRAVAPAKVLQADQGVCDGVRSLLWAVAQLLAPLEPHLRVPQLSRTVGARKLVSTLIKPAMPLRVVMFQGTLRRGQEPLDSNSVKHDLKVYSGLQ